MAKGTKLSEFKKDEITAMKRVGKSQREISKAFVCSKIVICNYSKSPNKYVTRKPTGRPEKLSLLFKRRIVHEVKKKTSSIAKILKSLVDALCSTKTISREKIMHKKRIHRPRLTMKHKEKRLEYARQYQTINAKEWRTIVFSDKNKFSLDGPDGFQKYGLAKNFPEENNSTRQSGEGSLMIYGMGASHLQENLNYHLSVVDKKQQIM